MVPFYVARVSDLGPSDFVHVECACGHIERLTAAMLTTAGVGPVEKVQGWEIECGAGRATRRVEPWSRSAGLLDDLNLPPFACSDFSASDVVRRSAWSVATRVAGDRDARRTGVKPRTPISGLEARLKCRDCDRAERSSA